MSARYARRFLACAQFLACVHLLACSDLSATNPYDPETPRDQQAPGSIHGQVRLLRFGSPEATLEVLVELISPQGGEALGTQKPDAEGRFTFNRVLFGPYDVRASLPGYLPETRRAEVVRGEATDLGILSLQHDADGPDAVLFSGRIRLRGETEHGGTTVRLQLTGRDLTYATLVTDASGHIETPASSTERYRLLVEREGWRLPELERTYRWYEVEGESMSGHFGDEAVEGESMSGHFGDEAAEGAPLELELLPSEAPVCVDGDVSACVEAQGACLSGRRVCANGQWGACDALSDELCDNVDNDCDGVIDEEITGDRACRIANAASTCRQGLCVVVQCLGSFVDVDLKSSNGCECKPSGQEAGACDYLDNDCDGAVDEDIHTDVDPANCGVCGRICEFDQATSLCLEGECILTGCEDDFHDFDGDPLNGCEAACTVSEGGVEVCDYRDNDCDGSVDEDHLPLETNVRNCGACGNDCRRFANGSFSCVENRCAVVNCEPGFRDLDGDVSTGCEYACLPTNAGLEACDDLDNDCDGRVDEEFDLQSDTANCGACGELCTTPNATPACIDARCRIARCDPGWVDGDSNPSDGCEAPCEGSAERCNDVDDDCDGEIDEAFPELGQPCTAGVGACRAPGVYICEADGDGARCGAVPLSPGDELCNGADDDCDGTVDDGFDLDSDGFTQCSGDCNDGDPGVHPGAPETCDGRNEDCDAETDEGFDLATDALNCGRCGGVCAGAAADMRCRAGSCEVDRCARGFFDIDAQARNGCEYACVVSVPPDERCDLRDNDCDGETDEDFNIGVPCDGVGACGQGRTECRPGGVAGCSTAPGGQDDRSAPEQCNLIDDDCDGEIDEDFDLLADVENCGTCGRVCDLDGASAACVAGDCEIVQCRGGRFDLDAEPATGCEYACVPSASPDELCDHRDNDCDGEVDEAWPIGEFCVSTGECGAGAFECDDTGMDVQCDSAPGSSRERNLPEQCNGLDDDCNGEVDNDVSAGLVATDPRNCGACGATCPQRPSATAVCTEGECDFVCLPGNLDGDRLAANGCEIACGPPQVVRLEGGNSAAIRAGLAQAGQCGVLELSGAFDLDDALPIVLSEPGTTLRAGPAGAILTLSVPARVPVFEITGPGTTLRGLQMEMAGVPRAAIRAVNTGALTLADLVIREGRLGCGADETGQHALIDLESVEGAAVTNLTATGVTFADGAGALGPPCAGVAMSVLQSTTSHRVSILDATLSLGFMTRILGEGTMLNFRWTNDSEVVGASINFSGVSGTDAAGTVAPLRVISLYQSNRNLIERNTIVGGDGSTVGAIGLYLSGTRNRIQFNTFGVLGPARSCLSMAISVRDTNNTAVDNTFYGGRFLLHGEPGPLEVIGFATALPRTPTNLGAVVIANARSPLIQGVSVVYNAAANVGCMVAGRGLDDLPDAYDGGIHIIDSTDIHVESNVVAEAATDMASITTTCGHAGLVLQRVRGGEVVGNSLAAPMRVPPGRGCSNGSYLQASLGVVGGSDVHLEANTLTGRNNVFVVATGNIVVEGSTGIRLGSHTLSTLVFDGPGGVIEDLEVSEQTEITSPGGTVRRLRMTGAGNQFFNASAHLSGDGLLFEDSVVGRPDCIPQAYYVVHFSGDHATMRNVDAYCQRGSPTLTLPFSQASAMTVENSLFDIRGDRTALYLRGYGQFTFDGVTFAHTGGQSDPLFNSDTIQPLVIRNSIVPHFPRLVDYIGPAPCCGRQLEVRASYTDFWQVTDLQPALVQMGVGNLFEDPRFRAAATFDFRLAPGSPAIDAADPALPVGAEPVPNGGRRDLGAYGGTSRATASGP